MSASSVETKQIAKSEVSSGSSLKRAEGFHSAPNLKCRMLARKPQTRQAGFISGTIANGLSSDIRQRVLSARQHRQKSLQNQLNLALQQNAELANENRLFRTLHKRQDNALAKYENSAGELPQLISSHAEELRVWQMKYRGLILQNRELTKKVQLKDKMLNELNDRVKHLTTLTTEKQLEEREVLTNKVESLERKLEEKEEEIKILARRNILEAKNFKTQLINERKKYKELTQKQTTQKPHEKIISSNDSDYSSAKDVKECNLKVKHFNGISLSASSAISEETPPMDLHADTEDDDDLVIKQIMDKEIDADQNDASHQIAKKLAEIQLFAKNDGDNIHKIQKKIQKDIEKNEALLDLHCDEISRDIDSHTGSKDSALFDVVQATEMIRDEKTFKPWNNFMLLKTNPPHESATMHSDRSKIPRTTSCLPRFNINLANKPVKRTPIDPQKKNKLLAQLKSIEAGNENL